MRLRVVSYNVHQCRGLDRQVRPDRIVRVLEQIDADLVGLQEVLSISGAEPELDQARYIASRLRHDHFFAGENLRRDGGGYGNVVISRFPVIASTNYDIGYPGREPRGCLRSDIQAPDGRRLHFFNLHLGLAWRERRAQARQLLDGNILRSQDLAGPRLLVGDFNEWTRGLATRRLRREFHCVDVRRFWLRRMRSYPGILPLLHLDNIYFDPAFRLADFRVHRTREAVIASDHLPLVAAFEW